MKPLVQSGLEASQGWSLECKVGAEWSGGYNEVRFRFTNPEKGQAIILTALGEFTAGGPS